MDRSFDEKYLETSAYASAREFYDLIEATVPTFRSNDYAKANNVRVWLYEGSTEDLHQSIADQTKELALNDDMVFDMSGELVPKDERTLQEAFQLNPKKIIIIEFKDSRKGWCIKNDKVPPERRCEECSEWKQMEDIVPCVCKKVFYCSQ